LRAIVGDNTLPLTELCGKPRSHAFEPMVRHAMVLGANAVNRPPLRCNRAVAGHRTGSEQSGNVYKNLDAGNYFAKRPTVIASAGQ
jgi:uncharacterized protein YbjQ (UPF0145 family)